MPAHKHETCIYCNWPLSKDNPSFPEGIEYSRCLCDLKREWQDARRRTIDSSYWGLRVCNWNPGIYAADKAGSFPSYIKVQRLMTLKKIWEYCFRRSSDKQSALSSSIAAGRNLFIRGPTNSGRGLLAACVKEEATLTSIGVTPLPCEFPIFKNEIQESESQSRLGDEARIAVSSRYLAPDLLVIENVRADTNINMGGKWVAKKFRAAGTIDWLLAKRMCKKGSILMTSHDFIGEISSLMGDVMMDVLVSPKTIPILLLSVKEAEAILWALEARRKYMLDVVATFRVSDDRKEKKLTQERIADKISLAALEDALYFEEAFSNIPVPTERGSMGIRQQMELYKFMPAAMEKWVEFREAKERQSLQYVEGKAKAQISAIKSCKELADILSDKECIEIGKMASYATSAASVIEGMEAQSARWFTDMRGAQ